MKTIKYLSLIVTGIILIAMSSCDDSIESPGDQQDILPERFSVDVPSTLANRDAVSGRISGRTTEDELDGNQIYQLLNLYIAVGNESGNLVEAIITSIARLGINRPMFISYESDDDGRIKNLEVIEDVNYEGVDYEFRLTITDSESEGNEDGGVAIQIFWNRSPIKGVAILKPYNIDRINEANAGDGIAKIEYSDESDMGYDAHMIVSLDGLPLENPLVDPFSIGTLKMFVGKTGDIVDVYGNSDHPNAKFFTEATGFNWAFVASGSESADIGVAEVGLPPNNLDNSDRETLLVDYSIKQVFTSQIQAIWPDLEQNLIDIYLFNTEAPGYFNDSGFIKGGTSPSPVFNPLVDRIQDLAPYNPADIAALEINFQ